MFTIPDLTIHRMRYVFEHHVTVNNRIFALRFVLGTTAASWPCYHLKDETDLGHIGPKQRNIVGPIQSQLYRAIFQAMRQAGWTIDTDFYLMQPPLTHTAQALRNIQDGGWK